MPVYCFKCIGCAHVQSEIRTIANRNEITKCEKCEIGVCSREMFAEGVHSTEMDYDKPILSDAMGVHPSQVQHHRRMHPDVPMTDDGRVIIKSHAEGKRIRARLGFFDRKGFTR